MTTRNALPGPAPLTARGEMGLLEHLAELRRRAVISGLALAACTGIGVLLAPAVLTFLQAPYGQQFTVLGPTSGVVAYFRVALMVGAMLAIPVITYQGLLFVLPGLTRQERGLVPRSLPAITGLFVLGVVFAWTALIPPALQFLSGFQSDIFRPEWTAELYLNFVTTLLFWMGVAFEAPLMFLVLAWLGLVTPRALLVNWRIAVVGSGVAAALITPTVDPINMLLVMGPLLALYVLSIALVATAGRLRRARTS